MKKDWKYIAYLVVFIGIYVFIQLISPKSHNWEFTLSHVDKNPYGTFVLNELTTDLFDTIHVSNTTFYEMLNGQTRTTSVIGIATRMNLPNEDTEALFNYVSKGNNALLSAHYFYGQLADTLNLQTSDYLFTNGNFLDKQDSMQLHFTSAALDTTALFTYRRDNIHNYFEAYDTLRTTVIARNEMGEPVTINIRLGKGSLILNSTPLAFTNINMLNKHNNSFVSQTLSYLNDTNLEWTEYYHLGRLEASTPLRFILSNEPLAWAYYIIIISLIVFIVFEAKRKQRIIPVIQPLANTTLEFVATIGNLYYQRGDHKNIAEKKIAFFYNLLRTNYYIDLHYITNHKLEVISAKTGNDIVDTGILFKMIESIQSKKIIETEELLTLNRLIEQFVK